MFSLMKQVFIVLLDFDSTLAQVAKVESKCLSLKDESCMARPTLINLNPVEIKYYTFMRSLDKYNESFNVLFPNMCSKKTKDIIITVFHIITEENEAKPMTKHISCNCKSKFNSRTSNSNYKKNNEACQCECKNYRPCKNYCSWNPAMWNCEIDKYIKSIADTTVIACDEIICYGYCSNKLDYYYSNKYCVNTF